MNLFGLILVGFLSVIFLFVVLAFLTLRRHETYFKKHKIPYIGAGIPRLFKLMTGLASPDIVKMEREIYREALDCNSEFVGMSDLGGKRIVYTLNLDLMRNIYVKDFNHFVNRRPFPDTGSNVFNKMIVSSESEHWKGLRTKLSPTFTTGRIKRMFQIFQNSSQRMEAYLKEQMNGTLQVDLDFNQLFPKYAMDVIANCAFGIDSRSFELPPSQSSKFEEMAQRFGFKFSFKFLLKFIAMNAAPRICEQFKMELFDDEAQNYLAGAIKNVLNVRTQRGERGEDFLQLMMDVQAGLLKEDEETAQVRDGVGAGEEGGKGGGGLETGKMTFDDDDIVANGLQFLSAGFDTTQTVLLLTLYALATEPEVQERLNKEVTEVMAKNEGKLTYEGVIDMKYLDMVINESLRKYPPATRTERVCTQDYTVPGTNFVIEKGTIVMFPILGVHQDSQYYPDAEKFMPERFNPENKGKRHPYAFMPFGHGPRNCIGMRFALVKVKAVIAQLVASFKFAPCAKTKIPMEFDRHPIIKPKEGDGVWLSITVREW